MLEMIILMTIKALTTFSMKSISEIVMKLVGVVKQIAMQTHLGLGEFFFML